jgi:hypothetical protein
MARRLEYTLVIECGTDGPADMQRVEEMISLTFKDLIYDDEFVTALGETQSISSQVTPILDNLPAQRG